MSGARVQKDLLAAAAAKAEQRVAACLQAGDLDGAMARYREALAALPVLGRSAAARGLEASLQEAVLEAMRASSELGEAFALARAVRAAAFEPAEPLASLVEALLCAEGQRSGQELQPMMQLQQAASRAGAKALAAAAGACVLRDQVHRDQIAEARVRLAAGELDTARAMLTKVLEDDPLHDAARRDLDLVDRGMADLDQRLEGARSAARGGRLREACTVALTLVGGARLAKDAKALVADVRARMGLVDRGLDEVRVALHGRAAATAEGVRHCLRRLEELAKVQCDHEDLPKVTASVVAEIAALEACEKVDAALDRQAFGEGVTLLGSLLGMRAQLLAEDRLDARLLQLLDRVGQHAELALARGQLAAVDPVVELLSRSAGLRAEFALRSERLARTSAAQKESAAGLVATAEAQLQAGDLAEAERLCELAQQQWSEGAAARSLAERLADLRRQSDALARVENLTKERDFHGAHQKLAALPPTPALLRTRIFDMKQSLARAQGLEGAFLLRVDEGGEHLVLRGETVSIGNVRQTRSDLPLLANIAGRHASIRRSMSFHGGMQDTVVAEEGEVRVGGKQGAAAHPRPRRPYPARAGPLASSTSGRAPAFADGWRLCCSPGSRSPGTDRVLLMKDRGRDGRILHWPRPGCARARRQCHAARSRCSPPTRADAGRVRRRGHHRWGAVPRRTPVAAGQIVEANGHHAFVLLPWRPGASPFRDATFARPANIPRTGPVAAPPEVPMLALLLAACLPVLPRNSLAAAVAAAVAVRGDAELSPAERLRLGPRQGREHVRDLWQERAEQAFSSSVRSGCPS
jgi:pyruvoyl-dependent arginine decarboxylase (PvlArgDC)